MFDHILYFSLGLIVATVIYSVVVFYWLKRKWQRLLMGFGAKLFGKGMSKVMGRKSPIEPQSPAGWEEATPYRESGGNREVEIL